MSEDTPQFTADDAAQLVKAVDDGHVDPKDLSPEGSLAYHIAKGNVSRNDLSPTGQGIFDQLQPQDSMANHPYLDAAEKTAALGGMVAGGMAGEGAGVLSSPVTGPVGPVVGPIIGAGLGYGAVKSGTDALNQLLGYAPKQDLSENAASTVDAVKDGAQMEAMGGAAREGVKAGIEGAKAAFPYAAKVLKTLPKPVADMLMKNPHLAEQYSGTPSAIENSINDMQDGLKALKDKASKLYDETLTNIGLGNPKSPAEAARKLTGPSNLKVLPPKDIGTAYLKLVSDSPNMADVDKLQAAIKINKSINATTKWAGAGQTVKPVADDLAPTLQKVKDGVMQLLKSIPGGDSVIKADETWHAMRQVYDTLQPNLSDTGKATAWLTKVISDEGPASATAKQALQTLQASTDKPVVDDAISHIAVGLAKRPMADSMMGKMGMILALAHPGSRTLTLPVIAAAQSPLVQTTAMHGLEMAADTMAENPEAVPAALAGLYKGAKALPTTSRSSMPSQRDD